MSKKTDKYSQAIALAKKFIQKNKRDSLHDLNHVETVWKNCLTLVNSESLKTNLSLLEIATYWHDVVVDEVKWPSKLMVEDTCNFLDNELPKLGFVTSEIARILEIIRHHEFRDIPKSIECMILQDADKIDATSIERGMRMLGDYEKGITKKEVLTAYMKTYLKWISVLEATFYFKFSRKIVKENIEEFWKNEEWRKWAIELGLENEYEESKANSNSIKVKVMRGLLKVKAEIIKTKILIKVLLLNIGYILNG